MESLDEAIVTSNNIKQSCVEVENDVNDIDDQFQIENELLEEYSTALSKAVNILGEQSPSTYKDDKIQICSTICGGYMKLTMTEAPSKSHCTLSQNKWIALLFAHTSKNKIGLTLVELMRTMEVNSKYRELYGENMKEVVSKSSLPYLSLRGIYPNKCSKTIYFCEYCNVDIESLSDCIKHFAAKQHTEIERMVSFYILKGMPAKVSGIQLDAIYSMLNQQFISEAKSLTMKKAVVALQVELDAVVKREVDEGCSLRMFGSYFIGNFTKNSNLNLFLSCPSSFTRGQGLNCLFQYFNGIKNLPSSQRFSFAGWTLKEVECQFCCFMPSLRIKLKNNLLNQEFLDVLISIECERYIRLNNIVKFFCNFRSQFLQLSYIFRRWSEECSLCDVNSCGLNKIAFDIMLIHFLQIKSFLPFFSQEILPYPDIDSSLDMKYNCDKAFGTYGEDKRNWNISSLWLQMLAYYVLEHDYNTIVKIHWADRDDEEIQFNKSRIGVGDPTIVGQVMQPVGSFRIYFCNCFLGSFLYLRIPRDKNGPILPYVLGKFVSSAPVKDSNANEVLCDGQLKSNFRKNFENVDHNFQKVCLYNFCPLLHYTSDSGSFFCLRQKFLESQKKFIQTLLNNAELKDERHEQIGICKALSVEFLIVLDGTIGPCDPESWYSLSKDYFQFNWSREHFTANTEPQLNCSLCGSSGHSKKICKMLEPSLVKLFPPLSAEKIRLITQLIKKNYLCRRMSKSYLKMIEKSRDILENEIRSKLGKHCSLTLFGSAKNGFGLNGSDADMCLRFMEDADNKLEQQDHMIREVASVLKRSKFTRFVILILQAKVPIIKILCNNSLEVDISLYNELAVVNTRLLRTYCDLDRRVQELGIALKQWAKMCNIGDASKGSLSSYSYIIMLIHFLQRTNPPVLPFLQEVEPERKKEYFHMVEGWDTFFYKPNELQWKTSNDETVGLLWVQFLDFYTKKFDFANEVVQIRQRNSLLKLNKGWELKPMAIEDPFNLDHNLSSGLQYKMMVYIRQTFAKSYVLFNAFHCPENLSAADDFQFMLNLFNECRVENSLSSSLPLHQRRHNFFFGKNRMLNKYIFSF